MKTFKRLIAVVVLVFAFSALSAQFPPPPNGGSGAPSGGSTPVGGGGAPIGSGIVLLIAMAAGYGGKKVYDFKKKE